MHFDVILSQVSWRSNSYFRHHDDLFIIPCRKSWVDCILPALLSPEISRYSPNSGCRRRNIRSIHLELLRNSRLMAFLYYWFNGISRGQCNYFCFLDSLLKRQQADWCRYCIVDASFKIAINRWADDQERRSRHLRYRHLARRFRYVGFISPIMLLSPLLDIRACFILGRSARSEISIWW